MYSVLVPQGQRDTVMAALLEAGIETRPTFYPVHTMPMYSHKYERHKVAEEIGWRGINLPSWPDLTVDQLHYIADTLETIVEPKQIQE
jgi:perosamine synthetase